AYLPVPVGIQVNWPAQIRRALSCSHYRVAGHQWVDGIHAIKIVSVTPAASRQTFWVDPATYLPVRALWKWPPGHGAHGMSLAGARLRAVGEPAGVQRDRAEPDPGALPGGVVTGDVEHHLVGVHVVVVVGDRHGLGVEVQRPGAERTDHEVRPLERLVHRRR